MLTMVIDHVGVYFFPEVTLLRMVGRLSFPLFAWLIANGAYHTKNINAYFFRLLVLAGISQIPYILIHRLYDPSFSSLNIFFTLAMGLGLIIVLQKQKGLFIRSIALSIGLVISFIFQFDYGAAGVLSILFFFYFFNNFFTVILSQILIYFMVFPAQSLLYGITTQTGSSIYIPEIAVIQPLAILSILFIAMYTGKEGPKLKYIFYPFYPVHLAIMYIIKLMM